MFNELQEKINVIIDKYNLSDYIREESFQLQKNTVGITCKQCQSDNIYSEAKQTRSGDEAATIFYTCLNCGNKWKTN